MPDYNILMWIFYRLTVNDEASCSVDAENRTAANRQVS